MTARERRVADELLPLICLECGGEMRLIASVTEPEPVQHILLHSGEPADQTFGW